MPKLNILHPKVDGISLNNVKQTLSPFIKYEILDQNNPNKPYKGLLRGYYKSGGYKHISAVFKDRKGQYSIDLKNPNLFQGKPLIKGKWVLYGEGGEPLKELPKIAFTTNSMQFYSKNEYLDSIKGVA